MKEQLINLETAKLAKDKGFDCSSNQQRGYNNEGTLQMCRYSLYVSNEDFKETNLYAAPTQSLLQKWLREVHNIDISINILMNSSYVLYVHQKRNVKFQKDFHPEYKKNTYEEALEQGLIEGLKLIK